MSFNYLWLKKRGSPQLFVCLAATTHMALKHIRFQFSFDIILRQYTTSNRDHVIRQLVPRLEHQMKGMLSFLVLISDKMKIIYGDKFDN